MISTIWDAIVGVDKSKGVATELIKKLPPFEGLSRRKLALVEKTIHVRRYHAEETVFEEDAPGAGLYVVKEGEIVIEKKKDDGTYLLLSTITVGSFFGEIALLGEIPRTARARATKESVLYAFCKPDLESIIERSPKAAVVILTNIGELISRRLIKTNEILEKSLVEKEALVLKVKELEMQLDNCNTGGGSL